MAVGDYLGCERGKGFTNASTPPNTVAAAAVQNTISMPNAAAIGPDAAGPNNIPIAYRA